MRKRKYRCGAAFSAEAMKNFLGITDADVELLSIVYDPLHDVYRFVFKGESSKEFTWLGGIEKLYECSEGQEVRMTSHRSC